MSIGFTRNSDTYSYSRSKDAPSIRLLGAFEAGFCLREASASNRADCEFPALNKSNRKLHTEIGGGRCPSFLAVGMKGGKLSRS